MRINKIYSFVSVLRGTVGGGTEISAMAFTSVITGKIFELICTYLHFTGDECVPTYQGPTKFFKIYPSLSFEQKISNPVNYQTRTDE